jgi:NADPH:quinone reductase-like Zn-dependent oxidoreductase
VDHVVDIGGAGTIERSLKCVKQGGLVSLVGFLASGKVVDLVTPVLFGGKTCKLLV